MSGELSIDFKWLSGGQNDRFDRAFAAEIGLALDGEWMTELLELESRTTMTHVRACAHTLGMWFAMNWWRLRWEPEPDREQEDINWRIAHSVASAGSGFAWPNVVFASDGEFLTVASIPRLRPAAFEPLRYLNKVYGRISAAEFERKVDGFISSVLSRGNAMGIENDSLSELWLELQKERRTPEIAHWRKLEALCGYDPDEAPAELIGFLITDPAGLGKGAVEEVAAEGRGSTAQVLEPIIRLARSRSRTGGFHGHLDHCIRSQRNPGELPWQRGAKLAQATRKKMGLGKGPMTDRCLADLMGVKASVFSDTEKKGRTRMPIALRREAEGSFDFYFNSARHTSRRFAASRLLGELLSGSGDDRLIPATQAKTARQQAQRAFAQELLCPFDALLDRIQTNRPKEEAIEEAANYFQVSPLTVRTTLVNKGELDRESLEMALWSR